MLPWARLAVCSPEGLLRAFATLFPCCLSIQLFCYDFSVFVFCSKIFMSLLHLVVVMTSPILPLTVGRIFLCFFFFWNVLFCLYCLVLSRYLFSLPSFASIFGWSPQDLFTRCRAFSVSSENVLMFRFTILACCRSLLICDSSVSSHSDFDFLPVVFKGIPIFFTD